MKKFIYLFIFIIIFGYISTGNCGPTVDIVIDHKPAAAVVIADSSTEQIKAAAKCLAEYLQKSTEAQLPIVVEAEAEKYKNKAKIWVGPSKYTAKQNINLSKLDEDGFIIVYPDHRNVIILGPTDWGSEFGVYEFLERYVGVRWLLPGPFGEYIPAHASLKIPAQEVRQEPVFFSRQLSGFRGGRVQTTWARRNRMHGRIQFHHNFINLFPYAKYAKTHPEFYPIQKGERYIPKNEKDYAWQPCFTAPGIVDEAVKNICDYFAKNPEAVSYSLGINDRGKFCECKNCLSRVDGRRNFIKREDHSDQFFEWANKVVEGVLKKYPDKWFGCLAYSELVAPPAKIKAHPRIIPFLTYDRMKWIDSEIEEEGKKITEDWHKQCPVVGWYDYIYGTPYLVPRVYFHKMADYYRYGSEHGVQAMYAEAYPNWGEGPKLYVALKLQWDPNQNIDALLKEWYTAAVGGEAAADLAAYYQFWEDFWTMRVHKSKWFTRYAEFLGFDKPRYLDLVTYEDMIRSRKLLESVVSKTKTAEQRARANILLRAFEYYEASVYSYLGLVKNILQPSKNKKYYEEFERKRLSLVDEFQKDPLLVHPKRYDTIERLRFK